MKNFFYYLSRFLAIIVVIFFGLFILEGFSPDFSWQSSMSHLLITLIPLVALLLVCFAKKAKIGGLIFILFGLFWCLSFGFENISPMEIVIAVVPILTGILFLFEKNSN